MYDDILPDVVLSVFIRDSKRAAAVAVGHAVALSSSSECNAVQAQVVVGPASSTPTGAAQRVFKLFSVPEIGYSATSSLLSDAHDFPFFLRVVPHGA